MKRKIAVLTGTRAEYGLLKGILKRMVSSAKLEPHLIVVGMHLSDEFGYTVKEIEKDGFKIDAKVDTLNKGDTGAEMAEYIGKSIVEITKSLKQIKPDILLILGDRGEVLAAAIAASCMNILIAHIHGGETSGSVDESFRHAITKLSHLHFVATKKAREKIVNMDENPSRIFVVGAPGLDDIPHEIVDSKIVAKKYRLDADEPKILLVQHPVVTEVEKAEKQMRETLDAIVDLGFKTIVIYPNADAGGRKMIKVIQEYTWRHRFIKAFKSIPRGEYLALMNIVDIMVGNSSSGIIEAPYFKLPVVNIGIRQKGRERAENIIDVGHNKEEIKNAIKKALFDKKFREKIRRCKNPYYLKGSNGKIVKILEEIKISPELIQK